MGQKTTLSGGIITFHPLPSSFPTLLVSQCKEGHAPPSCRIKKETKHDGEGTDPPHREMATMQWGGAYPLLVASKRKWENDGALPVVEQQQCNKEGHVLSSSRCGNDVVPVRVVSLFQKKGKFGGRTLYAQPLDLVPQPPWPPWLSCLRPSTPSSSSRHGRGLVGRVVGEEETKKSWSSTYMWRCSHVTQTRVKRDLVISTHESYYFIGLLLYNIYIKKNIK